MILSLVITNENQYSFLSINRSSILFLSIGDGCADDIICIPIYGIVVTSICGFVHKKKVTIKWAGIAWYEKLRTHTRRKTHREPNMNSEHILYVCECACEKCSFAMQLNRIVTLAFTAIYNVRFASTKRTLLRARTSALRESWPRCADAPPLDSRIATINSHWRDECIYVAAVCNVCIIIIRSVVHACVLHANANCQPIVWYNNLLLVLFIHHNNIAWTYTYTSVI